MARKKKKQPPSPPSPPPAPEGALGGSFEYRPFEALKGVDLRPKPSKTQPQPKPGPISKAGGAGETRPGPPIPPPAAPLSPPPSAATPPSQAPDVRDDPTAPPRFPNEDDALFESAMAGVRPLEEPSVRVEHRPVTPRPPAPDRFAEDLEVLEELTDLVEGRGEFDIVDTDEYIEGRIRGLHPSILSKLRKGRFSIQAHLDLHGLTLVEAKEAVAEFIAEARALKHRCILLIHGRGLRSKDQIPVLKKKLGDILLTQPVKRHILAFTTARPVDGGAGASYVLLRAKP